MARRWLAHLVGIATVALLTFGAQIAEGQDFCNSEPVQEIDPPFKGMRHLPVPPYGAKDLPLGTPGVTIFPYGFSHIATSQGKIGFYLSGAAPHGVMSRSLVSTQLSAVDRRGHVLRVLRRRLQRIDTAVSPSAVKLTFEVGRKPRIYRIDASFRSGSGSKVVHYADYFRVAKRKVSVRLSTNAREYRAGEVMRMRLENFGTAEAFFGYEFTVDSWNGSSWTPSSVPLPTWFSVGLSLAPGHPQPCQRWALPKEMAPGAYRLNKSYRTSPSGRDLRMAHSEFEVISP